VPAGVLVDWAQAMPATPVSAGHAGDGTLTAESAGLTWLKERAQELLLLKAL
jgi:hypothetical protein